MIFKSTLNIVALLLICQFLFHPATGLAQLNSTKADAAVNAAECTRCSTLTGEDADGCPASGSQTGECCGLDCHCDTAAPLASSIELSYLPHMEVLSFTDPFRATPHVYFTKFVPPQNPV